MSGKQVQTHQESITKHQHFMKTILDQLTITSQINTNDKDSIKSCPISITKDQELIETQHID
jgi:hypothetical protein